MNLAVTTNDDPVADNCTRNRVMIGGRQDDDVVFTYFQFPSVYIPSNAGEHMVEQLPSSDSGNNLEDRLQTLTLKIDPRPWPWKLTPGLDLEDWPQTLTSRIDLRYWP